MPEPTNEPRPTKGIRRALEEGTRELPDRVRRLPGFAVRTAVVGVDKLLTVTAKAREEYAEMRRTGVRPALERARPTLERARDDGIVLFRRTLDAAATRSWPKPQARPGEHPAKDVDEPARPVSGQDAPHLPEQFTGQPAEDELPLPNYDELTLGSIRARLRHLTIADLGVLLAYERGHQNRQQVVTMFENRILKLEREQGA